MPDKFTVHIETKKPYDGNIYAKGFFDRPGCRIEGKGQTKLSITLRFDAADPCGMRRRRQTQPRGMAVEQTVVVMFHNKFLTKVDRAFRIQCNYLEVNKHLTNELEVSMLTTEKLGETSTEVPECTYDVLSGGAGEC